MIAKKNKRGDLFALYFVPLVLTLVLMSILAFVANQNTINAAIVSPEAVLKIEDEKNIYEHNEQIVLNEIFNGKPSDLDTLKETFCKQMYNYSKFITSNRIENNRKYSEDIYNDISEWNSLCKKIYTFSNGPNNSFLMIDRKPDQKQILLSPKENRTITYNTKLVYTHSKEYSMPYS